MKSILFNTQKSKVLLGMLILLSACLAIAFDVLGNSQLYVLFKPLTTVLIILFSVFYGNKTTRFFKLTLLALIFCLVGDTLLLFESYFIWGLVAFLIAHLIFTLGFSSIGGFKLYVLSLIPLLVFGVLFYVYLFASLGTFKIPVLVYFMVIILMSWQGINLRIWRKSSISNLLLWAVILFLISDSILAWAKFKDGFEYSGVLILASYWSSIFLIALATSLNLEAVSTEK